MIRHGMRNTPTWHSWVGMKARCKTHPSYTHVSYDPRWELFTEFYKDMGEKPPGTELDKDIKGDGTYYSKETCCWVTHKENACHKRDSFLDEDKQLAYELKEQGLSNRAIAKRVGKSHSTINQLFK